MIAVGLKTEYLKNPIGMDFVEPRLQWNCEGGITQTAYQVVCRDDAGNTLWDSGKTAGNTMRVSYEGEALKSRSRVLWQVRLWDESDTPGDWSEEAISELGCWIPPTGRPCWTAPRAKNT